MLAEPISYKNIKAANAAEHDVFSLGEVMLRIDPRDVPIRRARDNIRLFMGGGETNVACGAAYTFGLRSAVLTALVDDPIGRNIETQLKEAGVDTRYIIWWNTKNDGSTHSTDAKGTLHNGVNFTYAGAGALPSETIYYRAHTPATLLKPGDFDFEKLFKMQGVRVFNTGGIFTLIGPQTADLAIEAARAAADYGTFVVADLNYRSKVQPDKKIARGINQRLAPYLGMLTGNDSDFNNAFGYDVKVPEGASFGEWKDAYKEAATRISKDFPNLSLIGGQWRGANDADQISWGAVLFDTKSGTLYEAPLRENVHIRDRTGGGDSFASGVIAALLNGGDLNVAVQWGAAHGILVQETPGDISMVTQREVEAEVKRALGKGGVKAQR